MSLSPGSRVDFGQRAERYDAVRPVDENWWEVYELVEREADVTLLALTHLSNRYFGPEIAEEARAIFPETVVPRDFDVVEVPFAERGSPRLIKGGVSGRRVDSAPSDEETR
jgi:hypothetical protein